MGSGTTIPERTDGPALKALQVDIVSGPDAPRSHRASTDVVTIGTGEGNDIVLTDERVSRYHLELGRKGDRILVVDHGSTNGTGIASVLIERATVTPGTILKIGRTAIRVDDGEEYAIEAHDDDRYGRLIGRSRAMRELMSRIKKAAGSDLSVLIHGETGTGKEVIAHTLHEASARANQPFEIVDCASLLPTLIASELFGHEKGAFTSAERQHIGAFERADGGTIFLDEIGELPPIVQASLLGALERRSFRRVGGQKSISVNVRVITATNRDLRSEVNAGRFRADLYYRMAVFSLHVPPLRDRTEDIPVLIEHFLREAGHAGSIQEVITRETLAMLDAHRWPGNARELRNFVDATLAAGEPVLEESRDRVSSPGTEDAASPRPSTKPFKLARNEVIQAFEAAYVRDLMDRFGDSVARAAREAGMHRSYLVDLRKRYSIR